MQPGGDMLRLAAIVVVAAFSVSTAAAVATGSRQHMRGSWYGAGAGWDVDLAPDGAGQPASGESPWAKVQVGDLQPESAKSLGVTVDGSGGLTLFANDGGQARSDMVAWGTFADTLDEVGWMGLSVHLSEQPGVDDGVKMYAAGVLEGFTTAGRIKEFRDNSRGLLQMNSDSQAKLPALKRALGDMATSLARAAGEPATGSKFDAQARLAFLQTWGVRDGYSLAAQRSPGLSGSDPLTMVDMFILNSDGVIDELLTKYGGQEGEALLQEKTRTARGKVRWHQKQPSTRQRPHRTLSGHCTGLVRLNQDKSELYFGHTTWEGFSEMTRIWKVYDFPLQDATTRKISFSSYPGCVSSTDDYYLMDSGLAITETTLNIPKEQHYSTAGSAVPDYIRIMAANRLSASGEDWVRSMADSATGTYSSQWMVVDYKKFTPGGSLPPGTFYVLEQAPGATHFEDMSSWLEEKGYWTSFDRAFFDDVRESTGDDAVERRLESQGGNDAQQAELFSKGNTPRAQIVRKTVGEVNSLAAMRAEMTRNEGTQEPVDQPYLHDPRYTISARNDLKDSATKNPDGSPDGGVDSKVTSSCLFRSLAAEAISSPSHTDMPPFEWTRDGAEVWPGYPHEGLPNRADFDWVRMQAGSDQVIGGGLDAGSDGGCQ